jgi:tetraacyldisaccharide 4'-kinase
LVGEGQSGGAGFRNLIDKPIYRARLVPNNADIGHLRGLHVLAFAGIGRPEKFFETLRGIGALVAASEAFPDHHLYTRDELQRLLKAAQDNRLTLITTAKDAVRIQSVAPDLAPQIEVLDVRLDCNEAMTLMGKLVACIEAKAARRA